MMEREENNEQAAAAGEEFTEETTIELTKNYHTGQYI